MVLLPIQFWTKLKRKEFERLNSDLILDTVQEYLEEKGYNYINRKKNKITFHKANGWTSFNTKSFLVSGIVKVKDEEKSLIVTNGNWMVFLIAIPFLLFYFLSKTSYSTLDEFDLTFLKNAFLWIFGVNLLIRVIAHLNFKAHLEKLIRNNYAE